MREVDMYSTVDDAVKIVVGNKVDKVRACNSTPTQASVSCSAAQWVVSAQQPSDTYLRCLSAQEADREVSRAEGQAFAKRHGCLFVETSAKANVAVGQAFEELVMKVPVLPLHCACPGHL